MAGRKKSNFDSESLDKKIVFVDGSSTMMKFISKKLILPVIAVLVLFSGFILALLIGISNHEEGKTYILIISFSSIFIFLILIAVSIISLLRHNSRKILNLQRAHEKSEALLHTIIENIPDYVYSKDIKGRKTFANPAEIRILRASSESEVLGKDDFAFYPKELAERFATDDQIVIQSGQAIINKEGLVIDEKGEERWFMTSKIPLKDHEGKIIGLVGIGHDISERKKFESEISRKNEELTKLNKDKDRFISILAHDLKSPFNTLLGFSELLMKNFSSFDKEKIESFVAHIHNAAKNTYELLEELLMWAMSQSDKISFEPQKFNSIELSAGIVNSLEQSARKKSISIDMKEVDSLDVFADLNMFKIILRNLLTNGIKFTGNGGHVRISAKQTDSNVTFIVSDNGVGLSETALRNLFEITQTHSTEGTSKESGTGLSLLLCKEFVGKHGGKLWAESEIGKGSRFFFTLPHMPMN